MSSPEISPPYRRTRCDRASGSGLAAGPFSPAYQCTPDAPTTRSTMLRGMLRFVVVLAALAACGSKSSDKASAAPPPVADKTAPVGAKTDPAQGAPADDPTRHLQPDEGTLTIGKGEAAAGSEATIPITVK